MTQQKTILIKFIDTLLQEPPTYELASFSRNATDNEINYYCNDILLTEYGNRRRVFWQELTNENDLNLAFEEENL